MKAWRIFWEWAPVGTGAFVGGALIVLLGNSGLVRLSKRTAIEDAAQAARVSAAVTPETATRDRLVLPQSDPTLQLPSATPSTRPAPSIGSATPLAGLETGALSVNGNASKTDAGSSPILAALRERLAQHTAQQAAKDGAAEAEALRVARSMAVTRERGDHTPKTSYAPGESPDTGMVNAGFHVPDQRNGGEDLSFLIHDTFQAAKGPRPLVFVDENTGTLMFGLGWQH